MKRQRSILRILCLIVVYTVLAILSLLLAWHLRFDFNIPLHQREFISASIIWIIPIKLAALALSRQYSGLLSFFGIRDLLRLFLAVASSSAILIVLWFFISNKFSFIPPRGVLLIDFVLSFMGLSGIRLLLRLFRERSKNWNNINKAHIKRVGIVGAGRSGADLVNELFTRRGMGLSPECVFDDDPQKWASTLHGVPVVGKPEVLMETDSDYNIDKLIIALPTASGSRIKEVVAIANQVGLSCDIVPSMQELASGRVRVSKLRNIQIQDLLRRDPIKLEAENIQKLIFGKVIMVTGAGGSIGSELCRQIAGYNVEKLLLVEQCEVQLFKIEQELIEQGFESIIVPLVSDILDEERMDSIFKRFKPAVIFHAAAHKHVSLMEKQPAEAFRNNSLGTANMAEIAVRHGVTHFLLISTDKAINPTSVMGATKRLAEIFIQSLCQENDNKTNFLAVRFGNVLGSSGSVVPIFEKQIEEGGPVTVTDPQVTRFFMTIPEAVGLVLQAGSQSEGGEIFVLDMGESIKIVDLARQLIEFNGFKPEVEIEIKFTGLRPGEKLYEELSHADENLVETTHPKIMKFISDPADPFFIRKEFQELDQKLYNLNSNEIKLQIKKLIPEYIPFL